MRRLPALLLFTLGYVLVALFGPTVAALPALPALLGGAALLARREGERESVARAAPVGRRR